MGRCALAWTTVLLVALGVALLVLPPGEFSLASRLTKSQSGRPSGSMRSTLALLPDLHSRSRQSIGKAAERRIPQDKASPAEVLELLSQVQRDLEPWRETGITLDMVERAYCTEAVIESMRIQIINGSVFLVGPVQNFQNRARTMQLSLMELQGKYKLPDLDAVFIMSDKCKHGQPAPYKDEGYAGKCERTAPMLSNDKRPSENQCVLVPDFSFGGWPEAFLPPWPMASKLVSAAAEARPWLSRKNVIFWRGGDTNTERKILHESGIVQDSAGTDIRLIFWGDPEGFKRDFASLGDHCDFQYLLHLAGVAYSARLKYLLLCGSAVVFPSRRDDEAVEFWHHMLRDRHNVLLIESITWDNWGTPVLQAVEELRSNDTFAQHLGAAGRHLAAAVLSEENVERYWLELLTQYSALQTFAVSQHPDAVPLEAALLRPERVIEVKQRTCTVCPVI